MAPERPAAIEVADSSLGVDNLPDRVAALAGGMIYSVACDQQAVRLPLIAGALAATIKLGTACVLLTPSDGGMFLRKARLAGFSLDGAVRSGALRFTLVGHTSWVFSAAWSPDGQSIVYTSGPWKANNFYVVQLEKGKWTRPVAVLKEPGRIGSCSFMESSE